MSGRIFSIFQLGRFTIIPSGESIPAGCEMPIILGRQGAFGSGEHETTVSCLEIMPAIPGIAGGRALDLGCGTGILSIAAVLLGSTSVTALDLDPAAVRCSEENISLNRMERSITPFCGELAAVGNTVFDTVLANIYVDILIQLAPQLVALTRNGGHLLLSGVPLQDKFDLVRCYSSLGCTVSDSRIGEDFATYLFRKHSFGTETG